jgi:hypothetical protein
MAALAVAALGAWLAPVGYAGLGWAMGSMLGQQLFSSGQTISSSQSIEGSKLSDLKVTGTDYGETIPWVQGKPRLAGQIWWASSKRQIAHVVTTTVHSKSSGGKSKSKSTSTVTQTTYTYDVDLLIGLTDNMIDGVTRIWSDGNLVYTAAPGSDPASVDASINSEDWERLTVYTGIQTQLADPTYEAAVTTAAACAYRGRGYVFFESLHLDGSGQIPNFTFEVIASIPQGLFLTLDEAIVSSTVAASAA